MPESTLLKPASPSTIKGLECPLCRQRAHQHIMTYPAFSPMFRNRTVARCVGCGLAYMYPMLPTEKLVEYYGRTTFTGHVLDKAPSDSPENHHQAAARVEFMKEWLAFSGHANVLDIGAEYGLLETYMRRRLTGELQCHAVEPDSNAREVLEKNDIRWASDIGAFDDKTFDLIVLSHVFEHVNDPITYLKTLRNYCHEGTYLFLEVPNEEFRFKAEFEPHVVFYSPKTLAQMLTTCGYTIIANETCGMRRADVSPANQRVSSGVHWLNRLALRLHLDRLRTKLKPQKVPVASVDPLSVHDRYESKVYGDDRIWIRCLAKFGV